MEGVVVLYEVLGQQQDRCTNAFVLPLAPGKAACLFDLQRAMRSLGLGCCFSVLALDRGRWIELVNPAQIVPMTDHRLIELLLQPTANMPQVSETEIREELSAALAEAAESVRAASPRTAAFDGPTTPTAQQPQAAPLSSPHERRKSEKAEKSPLAVFPDITGVGRSLFNFAANAVKQAGELTSRLGGEMQVGEHRVYMMREIAEGGFSKVFLARDSGQSAQMYALKQMVCQTRETLEDAQRELATLKKYSSHPNIVELLDYATLAYKNTSHKQVLMLFPYYARGTIATLMQEGVRTGYWLIPEHEALRLFLGTARGLAALHADGLAHRDIKPENVLIADDGTPKLTDLGSVATGRVEIRSRQVAMLLEDNASMVSTASYRAPELTQVPSDTVIDERVDVWSMGCLLYAMAFGRSPFDSPTEGVLRLAIMNGRFSFPPGNSHMGLLYSHAYCDTITFMLNPDHTRRPTIGQVIARVEKIFR